MYHYNNLLSHSLSFIFYHHLITSSHKSPTYLLANLSLKPLGSDRLRALKRKAKSTVPVELTQSTNRTRNAEEDSVVLELSESIMPQQDPRMRIDIGIRVGNLAMLFEDTWHDLIDGINDLE